MQITNAMDVAASGMKAQSDRLRVIAENIANAESTGATPGSEPYRRQIVVFKNELDRKLGVQVVNVKEQIKDKSDFNLKYMPGHPAANADGYVLMPNVNTIIEMVDMREARRGYEANLGVVEVSKAMVNRTLELLR